MLLSIPKPSVAGKLCKWLESELTVKQGRYTGKPFKVLPWQRNYLHGAFAPGITQSGLTVARGNGKSTFLAGVALATVREDGPLMEPNAETVITAASFDQALIIFRHVLAFAEDLPRKEYRVLHSTNVASIESRQTGARLKVIGSDFQKAHGLAPVLILADEPAQWQGGGDAMFAALKTSLGKIPNSRFIALGTRARSKLHWFSRLLNSTGKRKYMQSHYADVLTDPLDESQWYLANPSLAYMPDLLQVIEDEAEDAVNDPGLLASFQSLRLNGGVSEVANRDMLVSPEVWEAVLNQPTPPREGKVTWGIDLGGAAAMSSIAACWETGRLETVAMFGADPDLETRAKQDGASDLYDMAYNAGELLVAGKRIPNIDGLFREATERFGGRPDKLVCDTWRVAELKDELDDRSWQKVPMVTRRQGYKDGGEDVRAWRKACVSRRVSPVQPSILLTAALAEAVTICDPAGNEKIAKNSEGGRRARARDDVAAAAVLAIAHGLPPEATEGQSGGSYGGLV